MFERVCSVGVGGRLARGFASDAREKKAKRGEPMMVRSSVNTTLEGKKALGVKRAS